MKRIIAIVLAVVIALGIMSTMALGYSAICDRLVGGNPCGGIIGPVYDGRDPDTPASHTYGGFLGIGSQTCNYYYYYNYYKYQCPNGHVKSTEKYLHEHGHSCGK